MQLAPRLILILLFASGVAAPAVAQGPWSIFVGGGAAGFGGASTLPDAGPDEADQFKPSPTTRFHLGVIRSLGSNSLVFDLAYSKSGLGGYFDGGSYSLNPALTLFDLRLAFNYRVATLERSSLSVSLGPMLQLWSGDATEGETRLGGAAAVTLAVPIGGRFGLLVSGSLGVAGSPFDDAVLENAGGYEPANLWTRELGLGVQFSP